MVPLTYGDKIRMPADDFHRGVESWMEDNAQEVRSTVHVVLWSAVFFLAATALFIYNEVRLVLVVREVDDALRRGATEPPQELQDRKKATEQSHTLMLIAAVVVMIVSLLVACFSVCFVAVSLLAHIRG
jgi:hypothetical protein